MLSHLSYLLIDPASTARDFSLAPHAQPYMAQRPEYWSELVSSTITALEEMHEFGVCNIVREDRPATTPEAIEAWQKRFHPASLPLDVKSFLKSSDGLKVTWQVQHGGGDLLPLGAMRINALAEMTPVPPEALLNERGERCAELPAPLPGGGWHGAPLSFNGNGALPSHRKTDRKVRLIGEEQKAHEPKMYFTAPDPTQQYQIS